MPYKNKKIVIIGGGVAGISFAATLMLADLDYIILDKNNSAGGIIPLIHNDPADFVVGFYPDGKSLARAIEDFVRHYGMKIHYGHTVKSIDTDAKYIRYDAGDGAVNRMDYDILVIASGSSFRIDRRWENAPFRSHIYYRISPHLDDFTGKRVLVIGSGDNAVIAAIRLAEKDAGVIIANKGDTWKARVDLLDQMNGEKRIKVFEHSVLEDIKGDAIISQAVLKDVKTGALMNVEVDKVVIKTGYVPNTDFVPASISKDEKGYLIVSKDFATNIKDIFAIGDVISGAYKRIAIAMGHGTHLGNFFLKHYLV